MTKAKTKAARRRIRRSSTITLAGGEMATQRPAQGHREPIETADTVVLQARVRQTGTSDPRNIMLGCTVGRRLLIEHISDRAELWQAVMHIRKVTVAYDRSLGVNRHPQCANILAPAEKMQADASSPAADLRTPEDKARQAVAAWSTLKAWLSMADYRARVSCERAVVDEPDQPLTDWSGVVLALRCVADGLAGRPLRDRARVCDETAMEGKG